MTNCTFTNLKNFSYNLQTNAGALWEEKEPLGDYGPGLGEETRSFPQPMSASCLDYCPPKLPRQ
jgi:hypothetical protein